MKTTVTINKNSILTIILLFSNVFYIKYFLIKPVYIISGLFVISYFKKKYVLYLDYLIIGCMFQLFLMFHFLFLDSDIGMILNANLSILLFPILCSYLRKTSISSIDKFLKLCLLFFFAEMIWRVSNPIYIVNNLDVLSADGSGWFYPYKLNSFIFQDSNYVALHLFCLYFISLLLKFKWKSLLFWILILLTFSRSVIFGSILLYILFFIINGRYYKYMKIFIYSLILFIIIYFTSKFENIAHGEFTNDGSFLSKFQIINDAIYYINNHFALYDYIFGIGLSHSRDLINRGAHNIFVVLLFETGILGFMIYFIYFYIFSRNYISKANLKYYILFISTFLLMGFSLGLYLFPIMVLVIACISCLCTDDLYLKY